MNLIKLIFLLPFVFLGCNAVDTHPVMQRPLYVISKSKKKIFLDDNLAAQVRMLLSFKEVPDNYPPPPAEALISVK